METSLLKFINVNTATQTRTPINLESAMNIIQSRDLVSSPGKYTAKVTSATSYVRPDTGEPVVICNLSLMNPYHLTEARTLAKAGKFQDAVNQQMTASQREGKDYIPTKGEHVHVIVDEVTTKKGVTGLFPVSISPIPVEAASKVVFSLGEEESDDLPED